MMYYVLVYIDVVITDGPAVPGTWQDRKSPTGSLSRAEGAWQTSLLYGGADQTQTFHLLNGKQMERMFLYIFV